MVGEPPKVPHKKILRLSTFMLGVPLYDIQQVCEVKSEMEALVEAHGNLLKNNMNI
jgi:hypothetical protein